MQFDPGKDRSMIARLREQGHKGAWLALLNEVATLAGPGAEFQRHEERPWASATFAGTRHTIAFAFSGAKAVTAGEAYLSALPDHEFALSRRLVADAKVVAVEHLAGDAPHMLVEAEFLLLDEV